MLVKKCKDKLIDAGKDWRQKEKGAAEDEIDSITDSVDMNLSKLWEIVEEKESGMGHPMGSKSQKQFSNWTTATKGAIELELTKKYPV